MFASEEELTGECKVEENVNGKFMCGFERRKGGKEGKKCRIKEIFSC